VASFWDLLNLRDFSSLLKGELFAGALGRSGTSLEDFLLMRCGEEVFLRSLPLEVFS